MTKLEKSALYRGFWDGMASPFMLFNPPRYHRPTEDALDRSWKRVGQAMREAMQQEAMHQEEQRHGRTTREATSAA
ncbi:MAG: hypothetical protein ACR2PJ_00210 [Pseudomonadales bacterium]